MKWLSAGLTFVNFATIAALILGMIGGGLSQSIALTSLSFGTAAAILAYLRNFTNGVSLWPENAIYAFNTHLRYPAGIDLFNALLSLRHVDLIRGLVWAGLLGSIATFYAFYRWGGTFSVAGFLFNGGII